MGIAVRSGLAGAALCVLAACGGGGGGSGIPVSPGNPGGGGTFTPGLFPERTTFADQCITPRAGTSDRAGTAFTEKMFLRSWTNELYLWYNEVPDINPASIAAVTDYFDALVTPQTTPSGNAKDRFHFFLDTDEWIALSQSGQSIGYGAEMILFGDGRPPRRAVVAFVEPGTPASNAGVIRGMEILTINGVDFVNDGTQAGVNILANGFSPTSAGQIFTFGFQPPGGGATVNVQLTSANITHTPVLDTKAFDQAGVKFGYILFNDHIATAEAQLIASVNALKAANVQELILDIRYNGGGFLDLANELAFMIAGPAKTTGMIFERLVFNNKNPDPRSDHRRAACARHDVSLRRGGIARLRCDARYGAADTGPGPRVRHNRPGHLLGERIHHQRPARRRRASVPDRLDHLRQAVRLLFTGQLRHDVLLDSVPGRERDGRRRVPRRLHGAESDDRQVQHPAPGLLGCRRLYEGAGRSDRRSAQGHARLPRGREQQRFVPNGYRVRTWRATQDGSAGAVVSRRPDVQVAAARKQDIAVTRAQCVMA